MSFGPREWNSAATPLGQPRSEQDEEVHILIPHPCPDSASLDEVSQQPEGQGGCGVQAVQVGVLGCGSGRSWSRKGK